MKNIEYSITQSSIKAVMDNLKDGCFMIPSFQRHYVWAIDDVIDLLNSIISHYPIGYIITWQSKDSYDTKDSIIYSIIEKKETDEKIYVLDGQQRLTSLYMVFNSWNLYNRISEKNKQQRSSYEKQILKIVDGIIFNFNNGIFEKKKKNYSDNFIKIDLHIFFNNDKYGGINNKKAYIKDKFSLTDNEVDKYSKTWDDFILYFPSHNFGHLAIKNTDLEESISIFNKINNKGKKLDIFESVNSFWHSIDISLEKEIEEINDELISHQFNDLDKMTFVDSLYLIINDDKRLFSSAEKLAFNNLKQNKALYHEKLARFKRTYIETCKILKQYGYTKDTLPSEIIIKWLSYLVWRNADKKLTWDTNEKVKKYIAIISLNDWYMSSTNEKLKKDLLFIEELIKGNEKIDNKLQIRTINKDMIKDLEYKDKKSMVRKLFCSYMLNESLDLKSGQKINRDKWSDLNLHHIFPLNAKNNDKKIYKDVFNNINSFANLILIDKKTNNEIKNKQPSEYIGEFINNDGEYKQILDKNFMNINYLLSNNFDDFIDERSEHLANDMNKYFGLNNS